MHDALPRARWDAVLLSEAGERRLRAFVAAQTSRGALEAQLARAGCESRADVRGCRRWHRSVMRGPLIGGIDATLRLCPGRIAEIAFLRLPPF